MQVASDIPLPGDHVKGSKAHTYWLLLEACLGENHVFDSPSDEGFSGTMSRGPVLFPDILLFE